MLWGYGETVNIPQAFYTFYKLILQIIYLIIN